MQKQGVRRQEVTVPYRVRRCSDGLRAEAQTGNRGSEAQNPSPVPRSSSQNLQNSTGSTREQNSYVKLQTDLVVDRPVQLAGRAPVSKKPSSLRRPRMPHRLCRPRLCLPQLHAPSVCPAPLASLRAAYPRVPLVVARRTLMLVAPRFHQDRLCRQRCVDRGRRKRQRDPERSGPFSLILCGQQHGVYAPPRPASWPQPTL
eukprot:SAG11_NODE_13_length_26388_cov_67.360341_23_plen_201_part_00